MSGLLAPDGPVVLAARIAAGSVDALIAMYALVRAFSFTGQHRYMRLCLSSLAIVLTYGQYSLAANPGPITGRTYAGWVGSLAALIFWLLALRSDRPSKEHS